MRKLFLFLMAVLACSVSVVAQNRTISGTVLDATNDEPLIGASIVPQGGGQGTQADIDGNFTISVPANVKNAVVSCIGYSPRTVELKDGMVVHLNASASELDDVIVVAYGNANKESLTGSVAVVGAKDIEDRPVTSATSVLEGNAPGVQVNSTVGQPGTDPSIRIRGFGSVNSSNAPIYVVDGIVFNGSIADLNPTDIESISVLKDAASAALYGNKAANGVILITTKRAKQAGKVEVTLSVRQGMYNRGLPEYDRLGADQWMETQLRGAANYEYTAGLHATYDESLTAVRKTFIDVYAKNNIYDAANDALFDENGKLVAKMLPGYTDLDWWDAVSRQGYRQEYNINAAAASEKYSLFASVGYLKEQGYLLRTDFERFNGRVNAQFNPTSYFKFGFNLNATAQNSEVGQFDSVDAAINPFLTMFTAPIYPYYSHDENGDIIMENGEPKWNLTAQYLSNRNVAYELRKNFSNYRYDSVDATLFGTAILPYGFELTVRGNLTRYNQTGNEYRNKEIGDAAPKGSITQNFAFANSHVFMQQLTWNQDYGLHHVDVLLGHENSDYMTESSYIVNDTQTFPDNYTLSNFTVNMATSGSFAEDKTESYLSRARYNYNQKYFAEASFRRDGSSRFHPDSRWGNFWSVGGSWIISRENFMQHPDLSWINYLKLRAAYGTVGNNAGASAYAYWDLYAMGTTYSEQTILYRAQIADPSIKWETTKSFDVGLEGTLFNDRLNFAVCYFDKRSTDLLFAVPLPLSAGSSIWGGLNESITSNIGSVSNRGWELSFSGDIIRNRDFYWSASIDATFLDNKIVSLPGGRDIESGLQCLSEGHSIYEYYTYQFAGVDQMTGRSLYYINSEASNYETLCETAAANGELVEINDKMYTTNIANATKEWCGTAIPTVYGSFGTNLSWKGINLGVLFTYSIGGKTYDSNYASLMSTSALGLSALHEDILKAWTEVPAGMTEESPNRIDPNGIPAVDFYNSSYDNASSSRWLTDASYLVFKNLNVSYDLPAKWMKALKMQGLNIGVSIDNLFTVTARKGMNPQQSYSGGQSAYFVTPRVFSFQLTAKF